MQPQPEAHGRRPQTEDTSLLRLLVERVLDYAIFALTPDGHIASWNAGAQRLKGYSAAEIIGQHFEQFYTAEDRVAGHPAQLLARARSEGRVEDEGWRVRKDGTRFWADVVITALFDDTGVLRGFAKVTRDRTEVRAAEEQLRQSEERFRTLVDTIRDYAIFLLSPEGEILTWNQGAQRLKGYEQSEIVGHSFKRFYTPEARAKGLPEQLLAAARADGRVEDEGWRVRKDGTRFWADVVITALRDGAGHLIGYAKVTRDLSDRRQAEHDRAARLAAERAAERIQRLQVATAALAAASRPEHAAEVLTDVAVRALDAAAGVIAFPTPDDDALEVIDVRGAQETTLLRQQRIGVTDEAPLAHAWRTNKPLFLQSRKQAETAYPDFAANLAASAFEAWVTIPLSINERRLGVLSLYFNESRVLDPDQREFLLTLGEVGAQAIDRARLYVSEEIARTEAEAAVRTQDEFLSVAAHELRTPVSAIKATAQLADRAIVRGSADAEHTRGQLRNIVRASDRLAVLIDDLLDVSRLRTGRLQLRRSHIDLGAIVEEIVSRYSQTEIHHRFSVRAPGKHSLVDADPLRVEQVLDNLLSNAVKYSPAGGDIDVQFRNEDGGVTLTVSDAGVGLPAGQEARIFEVFGRASNATVRQIEGLGLGLAICRQLVEAHGGHISATSPGEDMGTTLTMWLPAVESDNGRTQDRA
jgi:PAS domain S-box-containing protein